MSVAIREQITEELGVRPIMINSALVSAQSRKRLYWTNIPGVQQPSDKGILLSDILESRSSIQAGAAWRGRDGGANFEVRRDQKSNAVIVGHQSRLVIEMVDVDLSKKLRVREATKLGYVDIAPGECVDLSMPNSKTRRGRKMSDKSNCLTTSNGFHEYCGALRTPVYDVKDGYILIDGRIYPVGLIDGQYIIRKLTVAECKRLQTVPDSYLLPVSDSQAYKMLGNGWTVDVIAHILSYCPRVKKEPIEVLSMYDGMSCGHIALDKLGANISSYYATEVDKHAIKTTQTNYPDTIQLGDAFQVRNGTWHI